jgi:glycosyltransferase involved in cell wall biosynthesis
MKILMTSDTYLPRLGGGEYHVHYLLRSLRARGHDITLLTTESGATIEPQVVRLPYRGLFSLWSITRELWKQSKDVDLLHAHYSYRLAFLTAVVAFLRGKPMVLTQHGLGLLPQAGATMLQEIPFRVWRYWSMKVSKVIISTSDDLSIDIRALGFGNKIVHIPNGYDSKRFTPLPPPPAPGDAPMLLTVRRLVPKNGIQYLVAALPEIIKKYPNLEYVCVGDGRLTDDIKELAGKLDVLNNITFLGPKDHDALLELYKKVHVVVIPSTAESTSLSCIEAMALRKVVVASRVGGLVELIGSNEERGTLVPLTPTEHCDYNAPFTIEPEKITLLANAIIRCLEHPQEAQAKADIAAAYTPAHFDWEVIAKRTDEEAYRKVSV